MKRIIFAGTLNQPHQIKLLLIVLSVILPFHDLAGQTGIVAEIEWEELLGNERFLSNTSIFIDGEKIENSSFQVGNFLSVDISEVSFSTDSVRLSTTIENQRYVITAPNDIGLLLNSDKIKLVNGLKRKIRSQHRNRSYFGADESNNNIPDTIQIKTGSKHDLLYQLTTLSKPDSLPICSKEFPQASVINAFSDTLSCDGIFPLKLVFHQYGQSTDTLNSTVRAFIRSSGTDKWICWTITEKENLVLILEHPVLRFNHMLYLRPFESNQLNYWLADLHAFIPSNNVLDLFGTFSQSENTEKIEIK